MDNKLIKEKKEALNSKEPQFEWMYLLPEVLKKIGIEESILLFYFKEMNKKYPDFFSPTYKEIKEAILLSTYKIKKAIQNLSDNGLIEIKTQWNPTKNYYKLNLEEYKKWESLS